MAAATTLPRKRFTRDEVERMLDLGLFAGQRFELIDGDLIDKMGQKPPHANAIRRLSKLLKASFGDDRVQGQLPIEAAGAEQRYTVPEPDLAVTTVVAAAADFQSRHPRGSELALVVEVSDSTLRYDLTAKRDLYARAGVAEYWVLDLNGRQLIAHRDLHEGRYASIATLSPADSVSLEDQSIPVASLLP